MEGESNTYESTDATWSVTFSYGTVSGIVSCNNLTGSWGQIYSSGNGNDITHGYQVDGSKCWCRMTYPVRSAWIHARGYDSEDECQHYCSGACAGGVDHNVDFRNRLYSIAGN